MAINNKYQDAVFTLLTNQANPAAGYDEFYFTKLPDGRSLISVIAALESGGTQGPPGPNGEPGNPPFVVIANQTTAPTSARVGDTIINGSSGLITIGNLGNFDIGDIAKITQLSPLQVTRSGNVRGPAGANGAPGTNGTNGVDGLPGNPTYNVTANVTTAPAGYRVGDFISNAGTAAITIGNMSGVAIGDVVRITQLSPLQVTAAGNMRGPVGPGGTGSVGPTGPKGRGIYFWTTSTAVTNITQIPGMEVNDYIVNAHTAAVTIFGTSRQPGDIVQATSATAGTFVNNMQGAAGANGTNGRGWYGYNSATAITNISAIPGMAVNDYLVITYSSAVTVFGTSRQPGDVIQATSATAGTLFGSIRGPAGANGATWLSGATAPATTDGNIGDFHLNTTTGAINKKTAATTWTQQMTLVGATGPTGAQGRGFYSYNVATAITNISAISGMVVNDYIVIMHTAAVTVFGTSRQPGDVIQATSATAGTYIGNIHGIDAINLDISHSALAIPAGTSAAVAGTQAITIKALKGATAQSVSVGTITGLATGLTAPITNNNTTTVTVTATWTTSLTTANGVITIPLTIDGKSFTWAISWALVKTGATGANGTPGTNGATGPTGPQGRSIFFYTGTTAITNISQITGMAVGDIVVNAGTAAVTIFGTSKAIGDAVQATSATAGTAAGNIRGPAGATGSPGTPGTNGTNGAAWLQGTTTPPTGSGVVGDWYINTSTGDLYQKTGAAAWSLQMNIKGASGGGFFGISGSSAGATAKTVTVSPTFTSANLVAGTVVTILFTSGITAGLTGKTLSVSGTTAVAMQHGSSEFIDRIGTNGIASFVYESSYWRVVSYEPGGISRAKTITIAAPNSRLPFQADYVCTNTNVGSIFANAMSAAGGGEVHCLAGEYQFTTSVLLQYPNITISGEGAGTVFKRMHDSVGVDGLFAGQPGGASGNIILRDFVIDGNKSAYTSTNNQGINCSNYRIDNVLVKNVTVKNCANNGISCGANTAGSKWKIFDCDFIDNNGTGLSYYTPSSAPADLYASRCYFRNSGSKHIEFVSTSYARNITIADCEFETAVAEHIMFANNIANLIVRNNRFSGASTYCLKTAATTTYANIVTVQGNYFSGATTRALQVNNVTDLRVGGNTFRSNTADHDLAGRSGFVAAPLVSA